MASLTLTSRSFPSGGPIPIDCTCDGADKSPELTWSAPPRGTAAFAIIADDPDAPGGTFTHWVVFDIKADVLALPEAADMAQFGAAEGQNGFERGGYSGPCPPKGERHHYVFRVYALGAPIHVKPGASREAVESAMAGRVLAQGTLIGTYFH